MIAENNGIEPLVALMDSELEDVLVNAVNAIRVLCENNHGNKTLVAQAQGIEPLVEFLTVDSGTMLLVLLVVFCPWLVEGLCCYATIIDVSTEC